jgi:diguanylate cyclase (GGDEF)-like protein
MKILIAEDDLTTRLTLAAALRQWGYEVQLAADGAQALEALRAPNGPRLALLDWMMPELDGVQVIEQFRAERQATDYAYFILLTSRDSKKEVAAGLAHGADDYIVKPFDPDELQGRLRAATRIMDLQRQLMELVHTLESMAKTDPLTGLFNRWALLEELRKTFVKDAVFSMPSLFIIADIDHFKRVNDSYGHDVGDVVLKEVGRRLRAAFRQIDIVCRIGGEEFLVVAPEVNADRAFETAERARLAVAASPIPINGGQTIPVTVSCGVCAANLAEISQIDAFTKHADQAMYLSKNNGRNRTTVLDAAGAVIAAG